MNRLSNWQSNLTELIESRKASAFEWGQFDCTQFAFLAISMSTGIDHSLDYFGNYTTPGGALKLLRKIDKVATPGELMDKILGERRTIAFARRGDIVAVNAGKAGLDVPHDIDVFGPVLGVCYGATSWFVGENGLIQAPTNELDFCWNVRLP